MNVRVVKCVNDECEITDKMWYAGDVVLMIIDKHGLNNFTKNYLFQF